MSTINPQIATRHKAACITKKEDSCTAVLVGRRQTTKHVLLGPFLTTFGELHEQVLHHGRHDVPRGDGVDADTVHAPFRGEVTGELEDGRFAGVVGRTDEALHAVQNKVSDGSDDLKAGKGENSKSGAFRRIRA